MIDYAIVLKPNNDMKQLILDAIKDEPLNTRAINQTSYSPVRLQPIAINIETKVPDTGGQQGLAQLGIWVAAYFKRIEMLTKTNTTRLTLPLLYVSGVKWYVLFAHNGTEQIVSS